ncbi:sulfite exporter TauE/SafE family protein [Cytophaga hutchinsonii]|nr:sulfite exporter TauE/SafE family protein [Cytophaga hutchinsonii]SFX07403.1 hypothetical protein SAMN04487930_101408 [Cytophaga hutchinsonii ATCC 33406]
MRHVSEEDIERDRIPQGAFGVDEMDLDQLQDEIQNLNRQEANTETSFKFIDKVNELNARSPYIKILFIANLVLVVAAFLISFNVDSIRHNFSSSFFSFISSVFTTDLLIFISIGVVTQLLDGALGMGYGVACSSFLLGLGLTPAYTSATVHLAKSFNTGTSGISHLRVRSLNQKLFRSLLIPGIAGSVLGAWLLADVIHTDLVKPFVAFYLLILGILILLKPFREPNDKKRVKKISLLAAVGGFIDSIGGGGWGPIVTSNLLQKGRVSSYTVGSVNIVEFFVALSAALTFIYFDKFSGWQAIIGLIIGGVLAYPFTSFIVSKINRNVITLLLGLIVIVFGMNTLITSNFTALQKVFISFFQ